MHRKTNIAHSFRSCGSHRWNGCRHLSVRDDLANDCARRGDGNDNWRWHAGYPRRFSIPWCKEGQRAKAKPSRPSNVACFVGYSRWCRCAFCAFDCCSFPGGPARLETVVFIFVNPSLTLTCCLAGSISFQRLAGLMSAQPCKEKPAITPPNFLKLVAPKPAALVLHRCYTMLKPFL